MPKKSRSPLLTPTLVQERLQMWGRSIRSQRVARQIRAADLCTRIGISDATLRRVERGDPGAGAAVYLSALMALGLLDVVAPALDPVFWQQPATARARPSSFDEDDDF